MLIELFGVATSQPSLRSKKEKGLFSPFSLRCFLLFSVVFGAQLAFGLWLNFQGFLWNDALSRAANALFVLYSADPKPEAVGFVWMPLPTLVELLWVASYPIWPGVVSSGFASTLTTALAGGTIAALLLYTARRLGLTERLGWTLALLVAANPMLLLYGSNGMSEGVAAPFLTGAVAFLVLFWHSGKQRYVAAAALALALGFASLYEAVPYGAALFAALVLGMLWGAEENQGSNLRTPRKAAAKLGGTLIIPSLCVAALWAGANAVVMDDPFYFATSQYSNAKTTAAGDIGVAGNAVGDAQGTLMFIVERVAPFLIPGAFLLLVRALDGRFWRVNTLSLSLLLVSVPLGLVAPFIYMGASFGWLRYFMYPLFVAAGWGLYEIVLSRRRKLAVALVLSGWVVAVPVTLWFMANPDFGREEHRVIEGFVGGWNAEQVEFDVATKSVGQETSVATYLDGLPSDSWTLVGAPGWSVAVQVSPGSLKRLVLVHDSRFEAAANDPREHKISYILIPNPAKAPNDPVVQSWPSLWSGQESGFELVESFPNAPEEWRLYEVVEETDK